MLRQSNHTAEIRRGFTLTELLVVILIIGVLVALSFAAFRTIRKSAENAGCINNLRAIGNGIELYSQDHNGNYPAANFGPAGNKQPLEMYRVVLPKYVYGENGTRDKNGNLTMESGGSTFSCPAARRQFGANTMTPTYGFNASFAYKPSGSDTVLNINKLRITDPSKTMIMMDGSNAWQGATGNTDHAYWFFEVASGGDRRPNKNDKKNDFVHGGKVNVLFTDGHIEPRAPSGIPTNGQHIFWDPNGTVR